MDGGGRDADRKNALRQVSQGVARGSPQVLRGSLPLDPPRKIGLVEASERRTGGSVGDELHLDLTHRCQHCDDPLPERAANGARTRFDRMYCSQKCLDASRKTARRYGIKDRACPHCGKAIPMMAHLKIRFCCRKCCRAYHNGLISAALVKKREARSCRICKEPISPARKKGSVYCSKACKVKADVKRNADRRKADTRASGASP